ncbi:universal stress protein [Chitinasiproducens palmae]|uniref:Nucleotide-binding universal stress protein, UspA family n=1 Tax=Chitinasiproducens palmae TaxID=1770053 RepID=A0A1H2PLY6_9BURK|nr:universal stress protein [Chitinasiproducens palmae]SDV47519.1 Nucleotide-binding universal stress protein, UspA family [Chitinasiproducens palmae]
MFKHILFATDATPACDGAGDAALQLAASFDSRLTVYTCLPEYEVSAFSEVMVEAPADFMQRCEDDAKAYLSTFVVRAAARSLRCEARTSVNASPHVGIVEAVRECGCDLVVINSRVKRGLTGMFGIGEAQRLLASSPVPVLAYR